MNLAEAKSLLPEIRSVLEFASEEWAEGYDLETGSSQICARDGMAGDVYPIANLLKAVTADDRELMRKAPLYVRALLLLRDEAVREYRKLAPRSAPEPESPDFAAECAMKCDDPLFKSYLADRHGLETKDRERIAARVRSVLAISSRSELNSDPQAAERWKSLRADFEAWRRTP